MHAQVFSRGGSPGHGGYANHLAPWSAAGPSTDGLLTTAAIRQCQLACPLQRPAPPAVKEQLTTPHHHPSAPKPCAASRWSSESSRAGTSRRGRLMLISSERLPAAPAACSDHRRLQSGASGQSGCSRAPRGAHHNTELRASTLKVPRCLPARTRRSRRPSGGGHRNAIGSRFYLITERNSSHPKVDRGLCLQNSVSKPIGVAIARPPESLRSTSRPRTATVANAWNNNDGLGRHSPGARHGCARRAAPSMTHEWGPLHAAAVGYRSRNPLHKGPMRIGDRELEWDQWVGGLRRTVTTAMRRTAARCPAIPPCCCCPAVLLLPRHAPALPLLTLTD